MTHKQIVILAVIGVALVLAVVATAIYVFSPAPIVDEPVPLVAEPEVSEPEPFDIPPIPRRTETESEAPPEDPVLDPTSGIDVETSLTNPASTPPPTAIVPEPESTEPTTEEIEVIVTPPPAAPPASSEPQPGERNANGEVWAPPFGWIQSGDGVREIDGGHSDGDWNKIIGEM